MAHAVKISTHWQKNCIDWFPLDAAEKVGCEKQALRSASTKT